MKIRLCCLRRGVLAGAALLLLAAFPARAHAAFLLALTQTGGNVVVTGSGTLNLTALTIVGLGPASGSSIVSPDAELIGGPTSGVGFSTYIGGGLNGPTKFGSGDGSTSGGTGDIVGIQGASGGALYVPQGYTSGTALADSTTFTGATFANLSFTPGTYTYTWGTGADADSLTVPAPRPCRPPGGCWAWEWARWFSLFCAVAPPFDPPGRLSGPTSGRRFLFDSPLPTWVFPGHP